MKKVLYCLFTVIIFTPVFSFAQQKTQTTLLQNLTQLYKTKESADKKFLLKKAAQKKWALRLSSPNPNQVIVLTGIDANGYPLYTTTDNNIISAATVHTNTLWAGGLSGYNLDGSSLNIKGKIASWDGGVASNNHIELAGKILNKDFSSLLNHSTHVAGTIMANGINPVAKGMAYNAQQLNCYDFNDHISEMSGAASSLLLSNHSYGSLAGWVYNAMGEWEFWGNYNDTADYKFGIYNEETQMFDSIAYNAPYYLIVKSAGNNRNQNGPPVGTPYNRFDAGGTMTYVGNRPAGISNNDGYDIIPTYGVAKNVLTVGAIEGIASGMVNNSTIKMSAFSSWGPTDDGRIKPDIVANGVDVYSCTADGTGTYAVYNGTSMATPSVTGSLYLLQELYSKKNSGAFMRSSTVKALAIHTATESITNSGPDYRFGWGVLNTQKAAAIINSKNLTSSRIIESTLTNGNTYSLNVIASGEGKLIATLAWTDPVGAATTTNLLNNPSLKLIHDLDIRVIKGGNTYMPWVLNPATPSAPATKGDNFRDNAEKIEIDSVVPGATYTIQITHKGVLQRGSQVFSLIVSGVGGNTYCTPYTVNNNTVRIASFSMANISSNTTSSCDSYNDYNNLTANLEPSKAYNISLSLNNCNATLNDKIAKLFIDYNHNGSFSDAGELVYTSSIATGSTVVNGNFTTPNNLTEGTYSLMRLVVAETNNAASFDACTPASQSGSIQDYRVMFIAPANDISIAEIALPPNNSCSDNEQYVSVRLNNNGSGTVSNIPVNVVVKQGITTVATITGAYTTSLVSGASVVFTLPTSFTSVAGNIYSVMAYTNMSGDQNPGNDSLKTDITIASKASAASGQANICGNTASLTALNTNANQNYFWYNNNPSNSPIAKGTSATTNIIASTYYIGSGINTKIGAADKSISSDGDYQSKGGNYFKYTATVPVLLANAKMYTAYPGKISVIVADIKVTYPDGTYTYNTLNSTTIDAIASRPTQATGDVAGNDPADNGYIYNINLLLPAGNHVLIVKTDNIANIYRSKNIAANPYPYNIPNVFTITGNNATTPAGFYYYLYNMSIKTLDCESDRVSVIPVVAPAPTIALVGDTLISSAGISYQWIKDGTDITGETNQKYKPTATADYSCRVVDNTGCEQVSNVLHVVITSTNPQPGEKPEFTVFPNPAKNFVIAELNADTFTGTLVTITDIAGRKYLQQNFTAITNHFKQQINTSQLGNGVYVLTLSHGNKVYRQKLIIER